MSRNRWTLLLLVVAPALLLHLQHLGPGRIPFLRDLSRTHLPYKALATAELSAGRLPTWNPGHGAGAPLWANPNFFHLHPASLMFLALPYPTAFSFALAGLSAFGALGMALWLRARGHGNAAVVAGAAAFALGGLGASLCNLYNLLASYSSVPWALWASARLLADPCARRMALLALALMAAMAGGEPTAWAWGLLLGPLLAARRPSARALTLHGAAAVLSLGLVAAQLLPLLEITPGTVRGGGFTEAGSTYNSLHPARLRELVQPFPFGDPTRPWLDDYRGREHADGGVPFLYSLYPGLSVLALAIAGASLGPGAKFDRAILVTVALGSVVLALGRYTPVFPLLWRLLPPLHWFRYPEKLLLPLYLALPALAAYAVDRLARRRRALAGLAAALVAFELLAVHLSLVPGTASAPYLETPPAAAQHLAGKRAYFWLSPRRYVPPSSDGLAAFHLAYHRHAVPPAGLLYGVRYVLDPDPDILDTQRSAALGRMLHATDEARARLLPMTAIERVVSPEPLSLPWLRELDRTGDRAIHLYEVAEPMPFARLVPAATVRPAAGLLSARDALAEPIFDPRRQTVFEGTDPVQGDGGQVAWTRPTPATIELEAEGAGLLVVAETYEPGWSATIDGEPATIAPTNLTFIGVPVDREGEHRIRLSYRPPGVRRGLMVSLASAILTAVLLAVRRPRRSGRPT